MTKNRTALENLVHDIFDAEDVESAVLEESLRAQGVDYERERNRYEATVSSVVNQLRRRRLDDARTQRLSQQDRRSRMVDRVRARNFPVPELLRRMQRAPGAAVGHRDFTEITRDDLESQLADLILTMDDESLLDDP